MIDIVKISNMVLVSLSTMGYERYHDRVIDENKNSDLDSQLIFPATIGNHNRISEQELRQLFIQAFKKENSELFYSIETPTQAKYKFGDDADKIKVTDKGQSALLDMCIFKKEDNEKYNRIFNIEFKYQNAAYKNIAKDVLKLVHEEPSGAFILMLKIQIVGHFVIRILKEKAY